MILESNRIQKDIPIPLYYQLKELILSEIKNGNYPGGSMIPTESEICSFFHISRTTVRQAITELVQEGHLYRVKSKGTFVAIKPINQDFIQKLESFDEQIRRSGSIPSTEILELSRRTADNKVAEKLNLTEGDPVIYLYRKRFADKRPIVLVETFLPYDKCSFLLTQDLNRLLCTSFFLPRQTRKSILSNVLSKLWKPMQMTKSSWESNAESLYNILNLSAAIALELLSSFLLPVIAVIITSLKLRSF